MKRDEEFACVVEAREEDKSSEDRGRRGVGVGWAEETRILPCAKRLDERHDGRAEGCNEYPRVIRVDDVAKIVCGYLGDKGEAEEEHDEVDGDVNESERNTRIISHFLIFDF